MRRALLVLVAAACGNNATKAADAAVAVPDSAPLPDAAPPDAVPPDAALMVRVFGNVDYNGPIAGVIVTTLGPAPQTTATDGNGDFHFDAPQGSRLIMRADPESTRPDLLPMIRGVIAEDALRPRVFYVLGASDVSAAASLGTSFDPTKAIVEVDFRNAAVGGYGATLGVTPEFGIVYDADGNPQLGEQTLTGGDGTTLLLGGLPVGDATFAPTVPGAATLPCQPRDANPLPLEAGTVTWFDFECGMGTDRASF